MSVLESNDIVLQKDDDGIFDLVIDDDGDFLTNDFLDTSLLRSIYGERRALPNEVPIPQKRRGWIGNLNRDYEDGSKVWLFEQSELSRSTINGVKSEIENGLEWLLDFDAALSYNVSVSITDELSMLAEISIQRSLSKTDNRYFVLFENSGVTE